MRYLCLILMFAACGAAWSQAPDAAAEAPVPAASGPPRIDIDALEPAVDVSGNAAGRNAPAADASRNPARERPALAAAAEPGGSGVMDTLDLGTTSITGNQELPKVLYIVPWKRSDLGDIVGRPVNTLLDEVLAPIDPPVFERHLSYYETLYGEGHQE